MTTYQIFPVADSYVKNDDPNKNFGKENYIYFRHGYVIHRGFVKFNFTEIGTINKATIFYQPTLSIGMIEGWEIWETEKNWEEDTITWNNQPTWLSPLISVKDVGNILYSHDITNYIKAQKDGIASLSFKIIGETTGSFNAGRGFASRESEIKCYLIIETIPTPALLVVSSKIE